MNFKEQIINEYIEKFERDYPAYSEYWEKMEKVALLNLTSKEVEEIIKPFLYNWGRMGRVLGRKEFKGWGSNILRQIQANRNRLEGFRKRDLEGVNLSAFESDIKELYKSFKVAIGQIATAKVLHLICPDFFPLWDNDIARVLRNENRVRSTWDEEIEDFSGEDYYRFMIKIKDFSVKYGVILSASAARYRRSKLKILDEFLWMVSHRPLSIFF